MESESCGRAVGVIQHQQFSWNAGLGFSSPFAAGRVLQALELLNTFQTITRCHTCLKITEFVDECVHAGKGTLSSIIAFSKVG